MFGTNSCRREKKRGGIININDRKLILQIEKSSSSLVYIFTAEREIFQNFYRVGTENGVKGVREVENGKEGETTLLFVRVELIIKLNVMFNTIHLVAQACANREQV